MFVTTAGRTNQQMIEKANKIAGLLCVPYISRDKKSIFLLQTEKDSACIVVGKERMELFEKGGSQPFFFHPNSSLFRVKRLMSGGHDPFAEATLLAKGMSFLDCTLGLASDSIVASYLVGSTGHVVGIEAQKYLAYLVKAGLSSWDSGLLNINAAMRKIQVIHENALFYLKRQQDHSFDCVYFDPMFDKSILESNGIKPLNRFALHEDLQEEMIQEAVRVSRKRVVLKDHYESIRFEKFGFNVLKRKTAKFHFGWIEK